MSGPLGRRIPSDFSHIRKHPLQIAAVAIAERVIATPGRTARKFYDQGKEGACTGFSASWMMTLLNGASVAATSRAVLYKARWLYTSAQLVDEYPDTPPAEGSSVRAAMDVLRTQGHRKRIGPGMYTRARLEEGIAANKWATSVDDVRACLAGGTPVVFGINWYTGFDRPQPIATTNGATEYWIGRSAFGSVRGGHAICATAVSDTRQAVRFTNSWGTGYPDVWVPYTVVARLLDEGGEATVVTDR